MSIQTFIQGEDDQTLFGLIGHWLVDKKIHGALGMAVTADPGDIWLVKFDQNRDVAGFLNARLMKNKGMHIRLVHAASEEERTLSILIKQAIKLAGEHQCLNVWTNERASSKLLPKLNFTARPRKRGVFCRWEYGLREGLK